MRIADAPYRSPRVRSLNADHFHEECGVFGVYGHPDAAALTALGLHALQHRGQEAAGIVANIGGFAAGRISREGGAIVKEGVIASGL